MIEEDYREGAPGREDKEQGGREGEGRNMTAICGPADFLGL